MASEIRDADPDGTSEGGPGRAGRERDEGEPPLGLRKAGSRASGSNDDDDGEPIESVDIDLDMDEDDGESAGAASGAPRKPEDRARSDAGAADAAGAEAKSKPRDTGSKSGAPPLPRRKRRTSGPASGKVARAGRGTARGGPDAATRGGATDGGAATAARDADEVPVHEAAPVDEPRADQDSRADAGARADEDSPADQDSRADQDPDAARADADAGARTQASGPADDAGDASSEPRDDAGDASSEPSSDDDAHPSSADDRSPSGDASMFDGTSLAELEEESTESLEIENIELIEDRDNLGSLTSEPESAEPDADAHWSVPARSPRARTVTSAPPPPPPTTPRSRPPTARSFEVAPATAAADPGISPDFRAAYEATAAAPEASEPPAGPPDPLARPLETPTALDRLIAGIEQGSSEARAQALALELSAPVNESGDGAEAGAAPAGPTSKERIAALAYELGELCERKLDDEARAVKSFGRALQADPTLRPNLWAIRRVFYRRGLWPNLLKLIGAETRLAASGPARADLLVEKARILEDHVNDAAGAAEAYEQAIDADPRCTPALSGLQRLALRRADEAALERVLPLLAEASETPARRQAYYLDLVRLFGQRGGDELARAREFMGRAGELGNLGERGARLREWLAERSGEPAELVAALDLRAAELLSRFGPAGPAARPAADGESPVSSDTETEGSVRLRRKLVAVRRRQARIAAQQLGDAESAWGYLQQAVALLPGEPLLIADLADLAERLGKYDELAELVEGWESEEPDPARALSLTLRRADALFRGGHGDAARALLTTLAASQPPYLPILALRERDALARGDVAALAETYVAAGEAAQSGTGFGPGAPGEPDARAAAAHFLVAGDLHLHLGHTPELARARYAQALTLAPDYAPALLALAGLHERGGRLEEAAALYELHGDGEQEADGEQPGTGFRAHVLEQLVNLYQRMDGPGGRLDQVAAALRRLVALDQDDVHARWRLVNALTAIDRPEHREERAALHAEIAARLDDPDQRAAALLEGARIRDEELQQVERAIPIYRQVVETWPSDRYTRQALADALRRAGRWEELAAERRAEAAELGDGPAATRALREAAALLAERLDHPAEAAAIYRDLCDRDPDDADSLAALAEALGRAGDKVGAIEALEREVAARDGAELAESALYRLARRAEEAGRPTDAEEAYRRALAARPDSVRAAVALLNLAVARRDHAAEVDALVELAESPLQSTSESAPASAPVAAELTERAAWLTAAALGDGERALHLFERALELDPDRRGALLGRLLLEARAADPFALGEALADLAAALPPSYAAASLYLRAAALADVQGDESGVEDRMERALAAAPDDVGTLVVTAEYLPPLGPTAGSAGGGEALAKRAELFGTRAQLASNPSAHHDWQLDRAELLEACGKLRDALAAVRRVLEHEPDGIRALQLLRRICRRGGDRAGLARASATLARLIGDREGKLELLREAAGIFDGELRQIEFAVPVYRRIVLEDPASFEFERLHEILLGHDDVGGLFEILTQRIHHFDDKERRGATLVRDLVERATLRIRLHDDQGAARDLAVALQVQPDHPEALLLRAGALVRLGQASEAARAFGAFLERVGDDDARRGQAELALAEILAENMDDLSGAIAQLDHVVMQSPGDLSVRERLIDVLMRAGENRRAADELRTLERLRPGQAEKARDQLRLARLLREKLGERASALAALERARELDPLAAEPVRQLVELYPEGDDRRRRVLIRSAADLRRAIVGEPGRAALYERLGAIAQWMGDTESRAIALAAQGSLGSLTPEHRRFVNEWSSHPPPELELGRLAQPLAPTDWSMLVDPGAGGFAADVWSIIGPAVAMLLPREPRQLGFTKAERRRTKDLEHEAPAVPAFLRLFGCDQPDPPDIYVASGKPGYARAVIGDKRALYLGADVAAAHSAEARFALGRTCALLQQGTSSLAELAHQMLAAWFAAAAKLALGEVPRVLLSGTDARRQDELVKHLDRHLDRRARRALAAIEDGFAEPGDLGAWRRAALRTGARAGLLLCADLPAALDLLDLGPGARSLTDDRDALSLLAWAVSGERLEMRQRLGLAAH